MDMVSSHGKVVMFIKENIRMIKDMDMVSLFGLMEQYTKENGNSELSMEKGNCGSPMVNIKKEFLKTINSNAYYQIR